MSFIRRWITALVRLLFPNICLACNTELYAGEHLLCSRCRYSLPYTDHHLFIDNKVNRQLWGRIPSPNAMAFLHFRKGGRVQQIMHQIKYHHQTVLGAMLGSMAAEKLAASSQYQDIDLIIPVPLHWKRLRTRGYNQSECIAQGIAAYLQAPLNTNHLIRHSATSSQTRKNRYQRYENMKSVFAVCDETALKDKHILLVDDVITTGATIEACALELHRCGIRKLSIFALAFAD
ncbi:putative amidophosphoribosyl-transferase [Pedobacter sp. BAL39]|uniref:ComF family protein n=1 Tax=Pedobacter sp. BAL39 TaxID=391596 RepID=UPI00015592D2|nr:ComF family protein [Pedobacter sp. BAL39]EDM37110.1 putative amidophosphoribosyl-transferase [Pedobacter sp. BAL39]